MNRPAAVALKPRKAPQQARSAVTVEAIYTATVQVLLAEGGGRLTTTRVAERAGVSVGTMYQYFPHKQALLVSLLERHIDSILSAMEAAAAELEGRELAAIATGLAHAWLDVKTGDIDTSRALYSVAAEFDIVELMAQGTARIERAIARTLESASDAEVADVVSATFMVTALLGGSVRSVMESDMSPHSLAVLRRELPRACQAYLAQAARPRTGVLTPA